MPYAENYLGGGRRRARVRRKPASQGHPSQGAPTVGGATKGPPVAYHAPPASRPSSGSAYDQLRRGGALDKQGRQKVLVKQQPRKASERQRIVPHFEHSPQGWRIKSVELVSQKEYRRRVLKQATRTPVVTPSDKKPLPTMIDPIQPGTQNVKWWERHLPSMPLQGGRLRPIDVKLRNQDHISAMGLNVDLSGAKRFLKKNVTGRQTIPGGFLTGLWGGLGVTAKDALSIPANVVVSAYALANAAYKAQSTGDRSGYSDLWKGIKNGDPVALAIQGRWHEFGQVAAKHPLGTVLEFGGARGITRGVGRVGRSRVSPQFVRDAMSTHRASRGVEGTNLAEKQRYAEDPLGKAIQVQLEHRGERKRIKLLRKADKVEAAGDVTYADKLRAEANRKDPAFMSDNAIQHQVDVASEGLHQSIRRPARAQTLKAIRAVLPRHGRALVGVVAQGIAHANHSDIRAYIGELAAAAKHIEEPVKLKANRRLRAQLSKALSDPKTDMVAVERAARAYAALTRPLEAELIRAEMLNPNEASKARLIPYAARHIGVARVEGVGIVRATDHAAAQQAAADLRRAGQEYGRNPGDQAARIELEVARAEANRLVLSEDAIHAHMADPKTGGGVVNPDQLAFVTHAPGRLGDKAFNPTGRRAQGIPTKHRSGEAVTSGLIDPHPERLVEHGVQLRGLAEANRAWQRFVDQFALRGADGALQAHADKGVADHIAANLEATTGRKWRVIRANPWGGRADQLSHMLEHADAEGFVDGGQHPLSDALSSALGKQEDAARGPFLVVPDAAAQRLRDHAGVYQTQGPVGRAVSQAFRRTVLPLSPSWLTGNVVEAAVRTAVIGAGPAEWLRFRRVYNEAAISDSSIGRALLPRAGRQPGERLPHPFRLPAAEAGSEAERLLHMVPGGHYGGVSGTMVHVSASQLAETKLRPLVRPFHALYEKPGPGTLARGYRAYSDWVFGAMNAGIEAQFTRTMAGKYIKRELMDPARRKTNETAVAQAARGLHNTTEQVAMADYVRRAYGQYDSLSPQMRRWVLGYTPFGAWTWNALKFVYNVLPKDHPVLTAALAANHILQEDWRKDHRLDLWSTGALPPFLQGSIPLPGGGHLRVARYTPFGLFGDPLTNVASTVLPQFSGALMAMRGLDWKGKQITGDDGKAITDPLQLGLIAVREFVYGSVPGIGLGARLLDKGPSTLNPLNPVKPLKQTSKDPLSAALDGIDAGDSSAVGKALDAQINKALDAIDKKP